MAQRTTCLCDGKIIGIESIYTVIDGKQINIPEKLKELRKKSRNKELFCPCGCGANLILVAPKNKYREQHFRIDSKTGKYECHMVAEGKISVDSRVVLKGWLDDKLGAVDIVTRVPINHLSDTDRKYEISFLSVSKNIALSYCYDEVNLSDEKFEVLESNTKGINIIYVTDTSNGGCIGQYPEGVMKIQNRQGYCLLLSVNNRGYNEAEMKAVFYAQDVDGLWVEKKLVENRLENFDIDSNGNVCFAYKDIRKIKEEVLKDFNAEQEKLKIKREEYKQQCIIEQQYQRKVEEQKKLEEQQQRERKKAEEEKHELEKLAKLQETQKQFEKNWNEDFMQQHTQIKDANGDRWIKCEYCGKKAKESEFATYGGLNHMNLGVCKECSKNGKRRTNPIAKKRENAENNNNYDFMQCPECGGKLVERNGRLGKFIGCSTFPKCRYTRNKIMNKKGEH